MLPSLWNTPSGSVSDHCGKVKLGGDGQHLSLKGQLSNIYYLWWSCIPVHLVTNKWRPFVSLADSLRPAVWQGEVLNSMSTLARWMLTHLQPHSLWTWIALETPWNQGGRDRCSSCCCSSKPVWVSFFFEQRKNTYLKNVGDQTVKGIHWHP